MRDILSSIRILMGINSHTCYNLGLIKNVSRELYDIIGFCVIMEQIQSKSHFFVVWASSDDT